MVYLSEVHPQTAERLLNLTIAGMAFGDDV